MLKVFFSNNTSTGVKAEFHFADFLVNFFHESDDEVNEFVLVHLFSVEVGYKETDIIILFFLFVIFVVIVIAVIVLERVGKRKEMKEKKIKKEKKKDLK